ncbi:hypothetical protein AB0L82_11745 [Nocardia sp. NPDC052001]|uniref:hypothetical protein n=1 Tax=Nocardia sp. NPDC052001 TaxID=3154853 RepID=UPI00341C4D8E
MRTRVLVGTLAATIILVAAHAPIAVAAPVGTLEDTVDTDGDGLPDNWEKYGLDADGDGVAEVDLPGMGADPNHKDIFVEMDYMTGKEPSDAVLDRITQVFATSPVTNPDKKTGIGIHLDLGTRGAPIPPPRQPARDADTGSANSPASGSSGSAVSPGPLTPKSAPPQGKYDLGGGNQVPAAEDLNPMLAGLRQLKDQYFAPERQHVFHYMVWVNGYDGGCSSGNSPQLPGDTFIVAFSPAAVCSWGPTPTDDELVGTFVHELGHNLGLQHGGHDGVNFKPNYLSVLNYSFQTGGVPRGDGTNYFGYSALALPDLNEDHLDESLGLGEGAAGWRTSYYCQKWAQWMVTTQQTADKRIDWNCDGIFGPAPVATSINKDEVRGVLTTQNDWTALVYNGGLIGSAIKYQGQVAPGPAELDSTTAKEIAEHRRPR